MNVDKLIFEKEALEKGFKHIAGVDEVGRGPLAGPVVCAAVVMPLDDAAIIDGVDDSKKVSEKKRESLAALIKERAVAYSICEVSPQEIDEINILQATIKCMRNCVSSLKIKPDLVLVDAVKADLGAKSLPIIKGDALSYSIGAASILAKVYRDDLMREYAKVYPEYGFEKHKGYGTKDHIVALKTFGATPIHRKTFIKNFIEVK